MRGRGTPKPSTATGANNTANSDGGCSTCGCKCQAGGGPKPPPPNPPSGSTPIGTGGAASIAPSKPPPVVRTFIGDGVPPPLARTNTGSGVPPVGFLVVYSRPQPTQRCGFDDSYARQVRRDTGHVRGQVVNLGYRPVVGPRGDEMKQFLLAVLTMHLAPFAVAYWTARNCYNWALPFVQAFSKGDGKRYNDSTPLKSDLTVIGEEKYREFSRDPSESKEAMTLGITDELKHISENGDHKFRIPAMRGPSTTKTMEHGAVKWEDSPLYEYTKKIYKPVFLLPIGSKEDTKHKGGIDADPYLVDWLRLEFMDKPRTPTVFKEMMSKARRHLKQNFNLLLHSPGEIHSLIHRACIVAMVPEPSENEALGYLRDDQTLIRMDMHNKALAGNFGTLGWFRKGAISDWAHRAVRNALKDVGVKYALPNVANSVT